MKSTMIAALTIAWVLAVMPAAAQPPDPSPAATPLPWKLDPAILAGHGLSDVPPVPKSVLMSGVSRPRRSVVHLGEDIVVVVYEEQPVKLALRGKGMPYNEFIHVLAGSLVLMDENGQAREYHVGDFLMIPQGFTGTWETRGTFRELVIITREAWDATH
ncbi:MAG: cupin domain-containing protein [Steroidobacteraceae bacterium]